MREQLHLTPEMKRLFNNAEILRRLEDLTDKTSSKKEQEKDPKTFPPEVDTGIKLFPKELIEAVRRERSKRVYRKRTDDKVIRMDDYLLLGSARCSHCNRKLGLHSDRGDPKEIKCYYACTGRKDKDCTLRLIRTTDFDGKVWRRFSEIKKEDLQEAILQTSYILDTDAEYLDSRLSTVALDLEEVELERKRMLQQHRKGYIDDRELDKEIKGVLKRKAELEADRERCEKALYRRKDVEDSVERAVNYLDDHIDLIELLERYGEDPSIHQEVAERLDILRDVYLTDEEVSETVNRLKRRLIQTFIDPEKGIQIEHKDHLAIHGITGEVLDGEISNKSS